MAAKITKPARLVDFIFDIHKQIGSRPAGSREEKLAARYIKSVFSQYTDNITLETFKCNSRSTQLSTNLYCSLYCLGLLAYLMYPLASVFFMVLAAMNFVLTRFYDLRIFDFFSNKEKSQNVIAKIKPKAETKSVLIFSAHIDSPFVHKIYEGKLRKYVNILNKIFPACFIALFLTGLLKYFFYSSAFADYLYLIPFSGMGFVVYYQYLMVTYDRSFGANDNLSGISVLLGLANNFFNNRLNNLEIWLCAFGAEEPGSTGAKHFLKTHFTELKKNVKVLNIESVAGGGLYVVKKELDSGTIHDSDLIKIITQAARNLGIPIEEKIIAGINTDAAVFSYERVPASSLISLDQTCFPLRYHSREDIPQYISEDALQQSYKLCIEIAGLND